MKMPLAGGQAAGGLARKSDYLSLQQTAVASAHSFSSL